MPKEPTKRIFLGHTDKDAYTVEGVIYGPGTVDVPERYYDGLVEAVERVNAKRDPKDRINPNAVGTPPPVDLNAATEEELLAAINLRRGLPADSPLEVTTTEDTETFTPPVVTTPPAPAAPSGTTTAPAPVTVVAPPKADTGDTTITKPGDAPPPTK